MTQKELKINSFGIMCSEVKLAELTQCSCYTYNEALFLNAYSRLILMKFALETHLAQSVPLKKKFRTFVPPFVFTIFLRQMKMKFRLTINLSMLFSYFNNNPYLCL